MIHLPRFKCFGSPLGPVDGVLEYGAHPAWVSGDSWSVDAGQAWVALAGLQLLGTGGLYWSSAGWVLRRQPLRKTESLSQNLGGLRFPHLSLQWELFIKGPGLRTISKNKEQIRFKFLGRNFPCLLVCHWGTEPTPWRAYPRVVIGYPSWRKRGGRRLRAVGQLKDSVFPAQPFPSLPPPCSSAAFASKSRWPPTLSLLMHCRKLEGQVSIKELFHGGAHRLCLLLIVPDWATHLSAAENQGSWFTFSATL